MHRQVAQFLVTRVSLIMKICRKW